jgi:hypothetical protein
MSPQLSDQRSAPDVARRAHSDPAAEWLLLAALSFTAVTAAIDGRTWHAVGFTALGAAVLLRALRLTEQSQAWRWLVYLLCTFSIVLYALRLMLHLGD